MIRVNISFILFFATSIVKTQFQSNEIGVNADKKGVDYEEIQRKYYAEREALSSLRIEYETQQLDFQHLRQQHEITKKERIVCLF